MISQKEKINLLNLLKLKIFLINAPSFTFFSSFTDISTFGALLKILSSTIKFRLGGNLIKI